MTRIEQEDCPTHCYAPKEREAVYFLMNQEKAKEMGFIHCDVEECYGYPPRVEYRLTEHGKRLYGIVYQMTEWGVEHRRLMLG